MLKIIVLWINFFFVFGNVRNKLINPSIYNNNIPIIPNKYIVTLQDNLNTTNYNPSIQNIELVEYLKTKNYARTQNNVYHAKIDNVYKNVFNGFCAELSDTALEEILKLDYVKEVEPDQIINRRSYQENPIWNLDRIDQTSSYLNNIYNTGNLDGDGTHIYILDTGINPEHSEFENRIGKSKDFIGDGRGWIDCNGHGTHCAGTAAGTKWGVSKKSIIHSLRVLNCEGEGSFSGIIAGIDWLIEEEQGKKRAVGSLSLGGGKSNSLNTAVNKAVINGIPMVVAAGNENKDACTTSPASAEMAITVASMEKGDIRSDFSNYGSCVDIFAPGSLIKSASYTSRSGSTILSGTSMACPHVAGEVALSIQNNKFTLEPNSIKNDIINRATKNIIKNAKSPNFFLRTSISKSFLPTPLPITPDDCLTESGKIIGKKCIFPFKFNEKIFFGCTKEYDPDGRLWCSTKVELNNEHIAGNWGYCNNKCPNDAIPTKSPTSNTCLTLGGQVIGKPCIFPFILNNKIYNSCTDILDSSGNYWCSTKVDIYGKHITGNWGYCNNFCPKDTKPTLSPTPLTIPIPTQYPSLFPTIKRCYNTITDSLVLDNFCNNNCPGQCCSKEICNCNLLDNSRFKKEICYTEEGKRCVFPFKYKNKIYKSCTSDFSIGGKKWCSTRVDKNNNHIENLREWGYCNKKCQNNDKANCKAKDYSLLDYFCKENCPGSNCPLDICVCEEKFNCNSLTKRPEYCKCSKEIDNQCEGKCIDMVDQFELESPVCLNFKNKDLRNIKNILRTKYKEVRNNSIDNNKDIGKKEDDEKNSSKSLLNLIIILIFFVGLLILIILLYIFRRYLFNCCDKDNDK